MQEHGRHPELFGPRSLDHPPSIKPKSKPAAPLSESPYPYPYPPWTEDDTQVLLDFLRQRNQDAATDWDALKSKVRVFTHIMSNFTLKMKSRARGGLHR